MKKIKCNFCQSTDFSLIAKGNLKTTKIKFSQYAYYADIYKCNNCSLVFSEVLDISEYEDLLKKEKYLDEEIGHLNLHQKESQFLTTYDLIRVFLKKDHKSFLDIGCNTGIFLNFLKKQFLKKGKLFYGIEPSMEASGFANKNFKLNVENSTINKSNYLLKLKFDIVTMFDVIEHLSDPLADLKKINKSIKKGGLICITTHNHNSLLRYLSGKKYPMYMYQHFYHFTPNTLANLLKITKFKVIKINFFYKTWSIGYLLNLLRKLFPDSSLVTFFTNYMEKFLKFLGLIDLNLKFPSKDFFLIIAQKK
jgi:2-polyprenyl-3-methyl-5-hydroxy-6-metoxy-1,4-benzoquinol methylase